MMPLEEPPQVILGITGLPSGAGLWRAYLRCANVQGAYIVLYMTQTEPTSYRWTVDLNPLYPEITLYLQVFTSNMATELYHTNGYVNIHFPLSSSQGYHLWSCSGNILLTYDGGGGGTNTFAGLVVSSYSRPTA